MVVFLVSTAHKQKYNLCELLGRACSLINKTSIFILNRFKKKLPLGITGIFSDFNISKSSNN